MLMVVALGGNAFAIEGSRVGPPSEQRSVVRLAASDVVDLVEYGYSVVVTHGNGPQVGAVVERMGDLLSLDMAVAATEGWLGYLLAHEIYLEGRRRGIELKTIALVTRTLVSSSDEAFRNPTKYIGPRYSLDEAERLSKLKGWVFKQDPRGGWRRVVPSPKPIEVLEADAIRSLLREGYIIVAVGGGGIPVTDHEPAEAVIDKDLASQILANHIGADGLVILTDVDYVYLNYGKPSQTPLRRMTVEEAEEYLRIGQFPEGNMGPKVRAALEFVKNGGKVAYIGRLGKVRDILSGKSGTAIVPG